MKEFEQKGIPTPNVVNIIAGGTQVQGNVVTSSDCRIDGIIKGDIISKSKVIIGKNGMVEGNITCQNIEIEGILNAETLNAGELVTLKATANFKGNIITNKIAIEPGAEFSGTCKMQNHKITVDMVPEKPEEEQIKE